MSCGESRRSGILGTKKSERFFHRKLPLRAVGVSWSIIAALEFRSVKARTRFVRRICEMVRAAEELMSCAGALGVGPKP